MNEPAPAAPELPESERLAISARAILLGAGPRFARDAFGPVLVFYVVYKISGLAFAIAAATAVACAAWWYERCRDRSGLLAWATLAIIVVQAVIGLVAGDARAYLAPAVLANAVWGLAFIGSVVVRRPLAGFFAGEMYPFPPEVRASQTFVRVFSTLSLAWGVLMVARGGMRLFALGDSSLDVFVVVSLLTGFPLTTAMLTWSIWYAMRAFRRSEEWGWALR